MVDAVDRNPFRYCSRSTISTDQFTGIPLNLTPTSPALHAPPIEFVERKGTGHPDTICDRLAEELAHQLARDHELY